MDFIVWFFDNDDDDDASNWNVNLKHRHHHRRQKSHTTKSIQLYPLVTFYLKYPALPHLSISNLPIQLYPIYPPPLHKCSYSTKIQL